jgi:hypothetical protein
MRLIDSLSLLRVRAPQLLLLMGRCSTHQLNGLLLFIFSRALSLSRNNRASRTSTTGGVVDVVSYNNIGTKGEHFLAFVS